MRGADDTVSPGFGSADSFPLPAKHQFFVQADWNAIQIYERLISMFIQQTADKLVQMGPLRNGEHEVLMMLDEFGNGGRIDTVLTLAPLIRKNGVRFVFILQDGAQLERLYQRSGQKILMGASTIKLFMNFQNQEDATAVSMAAGKTTEWVEQSRTAPACPRRCRAPGGRRPACGRRARDHGPGASRPCTRRTPRPRARPARRPEMRRRSRR